MGDNYREVDLTANGLLNVGDDDLGVPNMNTYSINSNSSTKTLYSFQSDEIGNITNIGNVTVDWNGRRLESISQNGTVVVSYDYNIDGQRTKKTALDTETGEYITTEFFYNGDILAGQKTGNDTIIFMYDNNGDIFGFEYNGTPYYYVKNAQNDVVMVLNCNDRTAVVYQYDAWGNITDVYDSTTQRVSNINPITYRSYYYDIEMGVYYLNSRYYVPIICRFLSADSYVQTGQGILDKNMFAYCLNNPVCYSDPQGTAVIESILIGLLIGGLLLLTGCSPEKVVSTTKDAVELYDRWDTFEEDFAYDITVSAAETVDENCGKNVNHNRKYRNPKIKINPSSIARKHYYGKMVRDLKVYGKLIGEDMDITGLSWDELSQSQKETIVLNYIVWDPDAYNHIGTQYGFYLTEGPAKEVVKTALGLV